MCLCFQSIKIGMIMNNNPLKIAPHVEDVRSYDYESLTCKLGSTLFPFLGTLQFLLYILVFVDLCSLQVCISMALYLIAKLFELHCHYQFSNRGFF